jgi:Cu+-exporting ATPase
MRFAIVALLSALAACGAKKDDAPSPASGTTATTPAPKNHLPPAAPGARRVPIEVRKTGYVPNTLQAASKENLVLVFTRIEDTECGRFIKVKGTSLEAELPLHQPVDVPVTMPESGELIFACGMDMMHGVITVNPT